MRTDYPLWRSLVFWGGLLVMIFIVWSWVDSTGCISAVSWRYRGVNVRDSGVTVFFNRNQGREFWTERMDMSGGGARPWVMRLGRPGFVRERDYLRKLQLDEPMDQQLKVHARGVWQSSLFGGGKKDGWVCFIPHWLILLAVAVLWAGFLGWRWRRWQSWHRLQAEGDGSTREAVG